MKSSVIKFSMMIVAGLAAGNLLAAEASDAPATSQPAQWYTYAYACDKMPDIATPAWTGSRGADKSVNGSDFKATDGLVDPGFLRIQTDGGLKANYSCQGEAWNIDKEFTFEIRMKIPESADKDSPTVNVVAGDGKRQCMLGVGENYIHFGSRDVKEKFAQIDPKNYNVYRIVGKKNGEAWNFTLYVNGPDVKVTHGGNSSKVNQILWGDLSGKPEIGGTFEVDYVRWNNKQAIEPKEKMESPAAASASGVMSAVVLAKDAVTAVDAEIIEVRKIWDVTPHNAFTDLIFYKNKWYCTFREASAHVSNDGAIRVISSSDGKQWKSAAKLMSPTEDMREFKFSIAPDGRLLIIGAACDVSSGNRGTHQSYVYQSEDGEKWTGPTKAGDPNFWMWRMLWAGDTAYSFGYKTDAYPKGPFAIRLYKSKDGINWETHVENVFSEDFPNETSGLLLKDGTFLCMLRRDLGTTIAKLGESKPPYTQWTWKDLGVRIGSPHMLQLPDGRIVAPIRLLSPMRATLCWLDVKDGKLTEFLRLPSGGDSGYCGAVYKDGVLWVSYYSSHENKRTSVYLAKVKLPGM